MPQQPNPYDRGKEVDLDAAIEQLRAKKGVPRVLLDRMLQQESGGSDAAVSPKGAKSRFQVMPATFDLYNRKVGGVLDSNSPLDQAYVGLSLLADNYKRFRPLAKNEQHAWAMAVAGYHGNPDAVEADVKRGGIGIPDQGDGLINTRDHVYAIFNGTKPEDFAAMADPVQSTVPQRKPKVSSEVKDYEPEQITFAPDTTQSGSWLARSAEKASGLGKQSLPSTHPSLTSKAVTAKFAQFPQSTDEVIDALMGQISPAALSANQQYRAETGRNLGNLSQYASDLVKETDGGYEATIAPTQKLIRSINAYNRGGLAEAQAEAAKMQKEELDYQKQLSQQQVSSVVDGAKRGAAQGIIGDAQFLYNLSMLTRAISTKEAYGIDSPEYKALEKEDKANQEKMNLAMSSVGQPSSNTGQFVQGMVGGVLELPQIAASGGNLPIATYVRHMNEGQVEAGTAAIKAIPMQATLHGVSGLTANMPRLAQEAISRVAAGGVGAATTPGGLKERTQAFTQMALMPVPMSRGVAESEPNAYIHAQFGRITESPNQAGVPKGKVRVVDEAGADHIVIKPSTARNQRAIPERKVQDAGEGTPIQREAGQAGEAYSAVGDEARSTAETGQGDRVRNRQQTEEAGQVTTVPQRQVSPDTPWVAEGNRISRIKDGKRVEMHFEYPSLAREMAERLNNPNEAVKRVTVAETEPQQSVQSAEAGNTRSMFVNGEQVSVELTPENARKFDALNQELQDYNKAVDRGVFAGDPQKLKKGKAMSIAAEKRKLHPDLETAKERTARAKYEATNYRGKQVTVNGREAEVVSNPFGRVKVQFRDGSTKTVDAADVTAQPIVDTRIPTKPIETPSTVPERPTETPSVSPEPAQKPTAAEPSVSTPPAGVSAPPESTPLATKPSAEPAIETTPTTAVLDDKTYTQRNGEWYNSEGKRVGGLVKDRLNKLTDYGPPARETVDLANQIKTAVESSDTAGLNILLEKAGITDADIAAEAPKQSPPPQVRESQVAETAGTVPVRDSATARERSFPLTLEAAGLPKGTDLIYEVKSHAETIANASRIIAEKGEQGAREWLLSANDPSSEHTAVGLQLIDQMQQQGRIAEADALASTMAERLTRIGQEADAVRTVAAMSPEGILLYANKRIQKHNPEQRLSEDDAKQLIDLAGQVKQNRGEFDELLGLVQSLQSRVAALEAKPSSGGFRQRASALQAKLDTAAEQARLRLKERAGAPKTGGGESGASAIPLDIADYAIIGASKMARRGIDLAVWTEEMIGEFGEEIRPHIQKIFVESRRLYNQEKDTLNEAAKVKAATSGREYTAEELPQLIREMSESRKRARQAQVEMEHMFNRLESTPGQRAVSRAADILNVPRSAMSSGDVSAALRQGSVFTLTEFKESAKATEKMFKSFSHQQYEDFISETQANPNFLKAKHDIGVEFTSPELRGAGVLPEEFYLSTTAEKYIPGVKRSEQAFTTYLDHARLFWAEKFSKEIESYAAEQGWSDAQTQKALKQAGKFINVATGRGSLESIPIAGKALQSASPLLNAFFFAPRYVASRFQLLNMALNPVSLMRMEAPVRRIVMRKMFRYFATQGSVLTLAQLGGYSQVTNPNDPDWLKLKIGNTRYDTLAGMQQPMRLMYRLTREFAKFGSSDKREAQAAKDKALSILGDFFEYKLAPLPSGAIAWKRGHELFEPDNSFTWKKAFVKRITPLILQDMYGAWEEEGTTGLGKAALKAAPSAIGIGTQTYDSTVPGRPPAAAVPPPPSAPR